LAIQKLKNNKKILVCFLFLIFLMGCTKIDDEPSGARLDIESFPDQESWNSTITMTREGKKFAELWAGYIATYNQKKITILKDSIHADFYDKEGNHNSVLTADSGVVYNQTNNLSAFGRVVVVSDSGIILETEKLRWDNEKQKVISEVPVRFTTEEDTVVGDSFISDPDLTNYEIRNAKGFSRRKIPMKK